MEKTRETEELYHIAQSKAKLLGIKISEAKVGGASDGNFTAQLCPTLDGLGFLGDGIHSEKEHILREPIVERMALLTKTVLDSMREL